MWTRYAPPSLDWDFYEGTFYRLVTTWYYQDVVSDLYSCFVELEGAPFSRERVEILFERAYEIYNETVPKLDCVSGPLIYDSIFDETCWPLSACRKYTLEGFRDASLAFAAYYVSHREELHQIHFKADVKKLEKSQCCKKLFYLHKADRNAPLVFEALQHIGHCFMTKTFVLYGTMALQRFDTGFGFHDDNRSASPVYMPVYPTVHRYDAKRPADCFAPSGCWEMRKKTKIAIEEDQTKRKLAVRCAKKVSKIIGKCAGGLHERGIQDVPVVGVPSGQTTSSPLAYDRSLDLPEVTPKARRSVQESAVDSEEETCLDTASESQINGDLTNGTGTNKDAGGGEKRSNASEDGKGDMEDEKKKPDTHDGIEHEDLREHVILMQGLSQDSFEHSTGNLDVLVRSGRQVKEGGSPVSALTSFSHLPSQLLQARRRFEREQRRKCLRRRISRRGIILTRRRIRGIIESNEQNAETANVDVQRTPNTRQPHPEYEGLEFGSEAPKRGW